MKDNNTFHGYEYQMKCALYFALKERHNEEFVKLGLEKGDDFDLVYQNKVKIFQAKKVQIPDFKIWLKKFWRRLHENIKPAYQQFEIELFYICAHDYINNQLYLDLRRKNLNSTKLKDVLRSLKNDYGKGKSKLATKPTQKDWDNFIKKLNFETKKDEEVERDILVFLKSSLEAYGLTGEDNNIEHVFQQLLGKFCQFMSNQHLLDKDVIKIELAKWHKNFFDRSPIIEDIKKSEYSRGLNEGLTMNFKEIIKQEDSSFNFGANDDT